MEMHYSSQNCILRMASVSQVSITCSASLSVPCVIQKELDSTGNFIPHLAVMIISLKVFKKKYDMQTLHDTR